MLLVGGMLFCANAQERSVENERLKNVDCQWPAARYKKAIGKNALLFNGLEYVDQYAGVRGHQFYNSPDWEEGIVEYQGQVYTGVDMKYDIVDDILIIGHFDEAGFFSEIELIRDKVKRFHLMGADFFRVIEGSEWAGALKVGFYRDVYRGKSHVLARYEKDVEARVSSNDRYNEFDLRTRHFIITDGAVFTVGRKKSLLKALPAHSKEVKSFMKKNKYRLKENKEAELATILKYYDNLTE